MVVNKKIYFTIYLFLFIFNNYYFEFILFNNNKLKLNKSVYFIVCWLIYKLN